jgi:hypothetical protein
MQSLCESCAHVREVVTPKGSRFLLCRLSQTDPDYPRYPPQPVVRCAGYRERGSLPEGPSASTGLADEGPTSS